MNSSTSGTSSTSVTTTSSSRRYSGLISGLDIDTIVKNLSKGTQTKIDRLTQRKQLASWRQASYREVTTALQEFQNKYFKTSSSSNISNADFFQTTSISNSSSYLNVSGNSTNASKMVITGITQLAVQANFASNHKVSNETVSSMAGISDYYTKSTVASNSITINYGGTDYAITLDSEFLLKDTDSAETNINNVITELNSRISNISDLKDNVKFAYSKDASNNISVSLTSTDKNLYIKSGSSSLLSGLGLRTSENGVGATSISSGTDVGDSGISPDVSSFFSSTLAAGSSLELTVNGKACTLEMSSDISLLSTNPINPMLSESGSKENANVLQTELNIAISNNADLKGKVTAEVTTDESNNINVKFSAVTGTMAVTGGSKNMLNGFGLSANATETASVSGTANRDELVKTDLDYALAGVTMAFSLDGVSKSITFNESDRSQYTNVSDLKAYLQTKLDNVFGNGTVQVGLDDSNTKLTFKTTNTTSTFAVSSSDSSGILGPEGVLHMYAGESNRLNTNKTLEDLASNWSTGLTAGTDGYGITVNGKSFTFKATDTLAKVISTINGDSDANVTIAYSSTLDTFSVTADGGGANSKVDIAAPTAGSGNLATVLFGEKSNNAATTATLTYDFSGKKQADLNHKTITLNGVTYEFTSDSSLSDVSHIAIDISATTSSTGIAAAFSSAVNLNGYSDAASNGIVTFTSKTSGALTTPSTDLTGVATFTPSTGTTPAALTYNFSGKTASDVIGKTIELDGKTYQFTNGTNLSNPNYISVDISSVTNGNDIATAFRNATNLSGYGKTTDAILDGKVVFTADAVDSRPSPITSSEIEGTFKNGLNQDKDYAVTTGQDAILTMSFDGNKNDATTITRAENKFTLDDVNFELLKADPTGSSVNFDNPITFSQKSEVDDLYKKLSTFIDDYNAVIKLVSGKVNESTKTDGSTYAPLTDDQKSEMSESEITKWETNAKKGILHSDSLLTSLNDDLRQAMANAVTSVKSSLVAIGIDEGDYDEYGKLSITESDLRSALTSNPESVKNLFTDGDDGIAKRLADILKANINTSIGDDGVLVQKAGISSRNYDNSVLGEEMLDYTSEIKDLRDELVDEQDRYYKKFTALETYMSTMNAQASLFAPPTSSS